MLTLISTAVASGHSPRRPGTFCSGQPTASEMLAQMDSQPGRDQRHQSPGHALEGRHPNAKSGEGCNPSPPDFRSSSSLLCVIKSAPDKRFSLKPHRLSDTPQASTALRVRLPVVLDGPANQNQHSAKIRIGRFHVVSSSTPHAPEASTR